MSYLPEGLPIPVPENDGLDKPYWDATRRSELLVQRCKSGLAPYKYPRWVNFVPDLPKTATGNSQRLTLRRRQTLEPVQERCA